MEPIEFKTIAIYKLENSDRIMFLDKKDFVLVGETKENFVFRKKLPNEDDNRGVSSQIPVLPCGDGAIYNH